MAERLKVYWPALYRWFHYAYGRPIGIRDHKGTRVGWAKTGVFIGDGFGTPFYCVGAQASYLAVQDKLREIETAREIPLAQQGFISIIADDITIKSTTAVAMDLSPHIELILAKAGLILNTSKSFASSAPTSSMQSTSLSPSLFVVMDVRLLGDHWVPSGGNAT